MLPFTRLDDMRVGSKTAQEIDRLLQKNYTSLDIKIRVQGEAKNSDISVPIKQIGLSPDVKRTQAGLFSYPLWQRLIPFSLIARGMFYDHKVYAQIDDDRFDEYAGDLSSKCDVAAKNAAVVVKNGVVSVEEAANGQKCEASKLRTLLGSVHLTKTGTTVGLRAVSTKPDRSARDVRSSVKDAEKIIKRKVSLKVNDNVYKIDAATIGGWLKFSEDAKDKKRLNVGIDDAPVREYLEPIEKEIYVSPSLKAAGLGLNYTATIDALNKKLQSGDGTVDAALVKIPAGTSYSKYYSASDVGMQNLLDDIVSANGKYALSVRFLDGKAISSRGDVKYHPASTYKMFVAYSLLKRIASGKMSWSGSSAGGLTVSKCFDKMIINSDNTCAEWFGSKIGWSNINEDVNAIGLNNTSTLYGAQKSTVNDESLFLVKLQNGDILNEPERTRLLDVMKKQVYREGIPNGVKTAVADKVGFLDGDLHDAAIVYSAKQTYVLTIMTTGSSWAQIADAAAKIQGLIDRM